MEKIAKEGSSATQTIHLDNGATIDLSVKDLLKSSTLKNSSTSQNMKNFIDKAISTQNDLIQKTSQASPHLEAVLEDYFFDRYTSAKDQTELDFIRDQDSQKLRENNPKVKKAYEDKIRALTPVATGSSNSSLSPSDPKTPVGKTQDGTTSEANQPSTTASGL